MWSTVRSLPVFRRNLQSANVNVPTIRWATKKSGGSTRNSKDSAGRRLGLKKSGGQPVFPGQIILRQRGMKFAPGEGVGMGKDHTLYALRRGELKFFRLKKRTWAYLREYEESETLPKAAQVREAMDQKKFAQKEAKKAAAIARSELLTSLREKATTFEITT